MAIAKPPSESASRKLPNRGSSTFRKGTKRLSKLVKDKDATNDHATKRDAAVAVARHLCVNSALQTVRPCHSFLSTGTSYIASMSECNTSIDERQDSCRNSDEEMEEDRKLERSNSERESQRPWTPSTFLMRPNNLQPNRDVEIVGGSEESEPEHRGMGVGIHRSDSGALMTGSSSMAFSEQWKDTTRNKTPPSIKTSFLGLERSSSTPPPLSWTSSLHVPGAESDNSASLSSARTAPVMGSEMLFAKERQSSVHAGPGPSQRRSIVEFLHSNDDPISPLSAFSANLPSWSHVAESSSFHHSHDKGKTVSQHDGILSQEDGTVDEKRDCIYSIGKEVPHETTKWMVVPSNQTFRSVSVRKSSRDQKDSSDLSSIDVERADNLARPKRKLPEWIQFNSKMRSLWGRLVPGTAGEWQVSMVQTQLVSPSTPPTTTSTSTPSFPLALSSSTVTAAAVAAVGIDDTRRALASPGVTGGHPTLGQQGVKQAAEARLSLESAVGGEEKKEKRA
ncbi:hypothetical protein BGX29_004819 [Mortierella sp. GBA35]|nr:hypothetical protein BGX29_004819 [Mortierella sp. GBA35]